MNNCPLCKKGLILFLEIHIDNKSWLLGGAKVDIKVESCTNKKCEAHQDIDEFKPPKGQD